MSRSGRVVWSGDGGFKLCRLPGTDLISVSHLNLHLDAYYVPSFVQLSFLRVTFLP